MEVAARTCGKTWTDADHAAGAKLTEAVPHAIATGRCLDRAVEAASVTLLEFTRAGYGSPSG